MGCCCVNLLLRDSVLSEEHLFYNWDFILQQYRGQQRTRWGTIRSDGDYSILN